MPLLEDLPKSIKLKKSKVMGKIKEKLKEKFDNFIIKHRKKLTKFKILVPVGLFIVFILTAIIGSFINAPKIMVPLLLIELFLLYLSYVENVVLEYLEKELKRILKKDTKE